MQSLNEATEMEWLNSFKKKRLRILVIFLSVSIIVATFFIVLLVKHNLLADSIVKTKTLNEAIESSLRILMLKRDPDAIQETLERIGKNKDSIVRVSILDKTGRVAYSSDKLNIGKVFNRFSEESCRVCHQKIDKAPSEYTMMVKTNGIQIQRNIKVIYNEEACYSCHSKSDRINGIIITDQSLKQTDSLIASIELIIFISGAVCFIFFIPFLLKWINKYVVEITSKNREIILLFAIAKRLSKTIDIKELQHIVVDVMADTFDADEVVIVRIREKREYMVYEWIRGKNEIMRKDIGKNDRLQKTVDDWLDGKTSKEVISDDKKLVYMPIAKGDMRLALVVIMKEKTPFDPRKLTLIYIVSSYMAIAFDNARLYYIAISDELTQLYSQRYFRYCIEREFSFFGKYGHKVTLLMIDIDNFKSINDTYGHLVGDTVLKDAAQSILSCIRDNDLAFRYGGEEFAVLLSATDSKGGKHVAEKIRGCFEEFVFEKGVHDLKLTVSIGMSTCPDNATTERDLILTADNALYKAKKTGKNRTVLSGEE